MLLGDGLQSRPNTCALSTVDQVMTKCLHSKNQFNEKKRGYSQAGSSVPPQDSISEFIIRKINLVVVVDFRFNSAFLHA